MNPYEIISTNKIGANCLQDGQYEEAMHTFRQGVHQLKNAVVDKTKTDSCTIQESVTFFPLQPLSAEFEAFVFNKVAVLDDSEVSETMSERDLLRLSAVLIYNFALTHHTLGLKRCRTVLLSKADRLYKSALSLVYTVAGRKTKLKDPSMHRLAMAILNNRGHIAHELSNYDDAAKHARTLQGILREEYQQTKGKKIDPTDVFWMNATYLERNNCKARAA